MNSNQEQILDFLINPIDYYASLFCVECVTSSHLDDASRISVNEVRINLHFAKMLTDQKDSNEFVWLTSVAKYIDTVLSFDFSCDWIVFSSCQHFIEQEYRLKEIAYPYCYINNRIELDLKIRAKHSEPKDCDFCTISATEDGYLIYKFKPGIEEKPGKKGYIYCFKEVESLNVKFGYSTNIDQRLESIQSANGNEIVCIDFMEGSINQEKLLHTSLKPPAKYTKAGSEWYKLSDKKINKLYQMFKKSEIYTINDVLVEIGIMSKTQ